MILTDLEFDTLVNLEAGLQSENDESTKKLISLGLINDKNVTEKGYEYLEPYKVKKAVFMAAGFGSRLVPLTLEKPKPLIKVHGVRIMDRLLDAVLTLGIDDITIVRGYKKECMDELLEKYPMIKFIDNDDYNITNNISSMDLVKDKLASSYVFESDLVLYNPAILKKYARKSFYYSIPKEKTSDWCFDLEDGKITKMKLQGINTQEMVGISFWNQKDGEKLATDIGLFYKEEENRNSFWDLVSLEAFKENYKVGVNPVKEEDIIEIDTFDELKAIDASYR